MMAETTAILVFCCIVAALPHAVTGQGDVLTNCTDFGPSCTVNGTTECHQSPPCLNQGTCIELPGGGAFTCLCSGGWTGPVCDTEIDACASGPCLNGGTCTDLVPVPGSQEDGFRCECGVGWGGEFCGICDIAYCEACAGSPAACVDCEDGYRLNQTTAFCEEVPGEDDPFFTLSFTWTLIILVVTGALLLMVCLCVCILCLLNWRLVGHKKSRYSVTGRIISLDKLPAINDDQESVGFKVYGPNDLGPYAHIKPKPVDPTTLGLEAVPTPKPRDPTPHSPIPDAFLIPTFSPPLQFAADDMPLHAAATGPPSANLSTMQPFSTPTQSAIPVSRSMDFITMEPLAGSTPARKLHRTRSSEMLLDSHGGPSRSVMDDGMSTPGDTPPLPPRMADHGEYREYLSQPLVLYGVPLMPVEMSSTREALSQPVRMSGYSTEPRRPAPRLVYSPGLEEDEDESPYAVTRLRTL